MRTFLTDMAAYNRKADTLARDVFKHADAIMYENKFIMRGER